jgi:hypothetical protein
MTESNRGARNGFTLIELLIVLLILEAITIPLIGVYVLPLKAQANLSALSKVNRDSGLLQSHLSDDIRCADSISIAKADGDRDDLSALDELRIGRGEETVVYRSSPEEGVEREVRGKVPLNHTFDSIEAHFSLEEEGRYRSVRVDMVLDYRMLRAPFKRQRTAILCSRLE